MIREPTAPTLRKYGLSLEGWRELLQAQGGVCPICEKVPPSGRMVTDHEHCRGYRDMPPHEKRARVRGITCWTCNRFFLARGMNPKRADNLATYLRRYESRRAEQVASEQAPAFASSKRRGV